MKRTTILQSLAAVVVYFLWLTDPTWAQRPSRERGPRMEAATARPIVLRPARVWEGGVLDTHEGWIVIVDGEKIRAAGPPTEISLPENATTIDLPGMTLLPGLIDAHTHVLLHPYNEALWDDQVLKEASALRICRATNHLRNTLLPASQRSAIWERKGPGTPMLGSSRQSARALFPGRGCWS